MQIKRTEVVDFRTAIELSQQSDVGYWVILKNVKSGVIPSQKIGHTRFVKLSDFEAWCSTYKKWARTKKAEHPPKEAVIDSQKA